MEKAHKERRKRIDIYTWIDLYTWIIIFTKENNKSAKMSAIYKKVASKLANAGAVALVGYELGTVMHENNKDDDKKVQSNTTSDHTEVIVLLIILLIAIIVALILKIVLAKKNNVERQIPLV